MSSTTEVISHWNKLIENFQMSPQQFYKAIADTIEQKGIPNAKIEIVSLKESHMLSAKRDYLRIFYKRDFYFAVCGAPFGKDFFISSRLVDPPDIWLLFVLSPFPRLSAFVQSLLKPWTYYRIDSALMFQEATHSAILEVIDSITSAQGIKGLTETERKPIMRGFLQK